MTELVSTCRKKNIEAQLIFKKSLYFILFRTSIELFPAFCREFFDEVVKTAFYVSIATFWKKNASSFQMLGRKPSAFFDKLFDMVVKNCFLGVHGNKLSRKTFRWKPYIFLFRHWAENFHFVRKFFDWVVRTAFHLAIGFFWEEVSSLSFPLSFSDIEAKNLREFVECLSTGLSKLHSSCPKELFELNKFCKSCRVLFITFGLSDKKNLLSGRKISPCLSKVPSDCPLGQFEGRFFWKSFLAVFRDLAKKISVFPRRTFYGVVKTAFYGPRGAF